TAVTYAGQYFDLVKALDARGYLISARVSDRESQYHEDERFVVEDRSIPFFKSSNSLLFYAGQIWSSLGVIVSALRFRADVAIVTEGLTRFFLVAILPWFGIEVVPTIHCVLWRKYSESGPSRSQRIFLRLSKYLFSRACLATIVVSDEIGAQVRKVAGEEVKPILRSFPLYRPESFVEIAAPERSPDRPFRILFAGRVVTNKGVFDLLEAAKQLRDRGGRNIAFDVCGRGDALEALRAAVVAADLEESFHCHGHCDRDRMRHMLEQSHVAIVPTQTSFIEGFSKSVVEGVAAGRPTIASRVCNDLDFFDGAVLPVEPNNVGAYVDAIARLCDDSEFYQQMLQQCQKYRSAFSDPKKAWGGLLQQLFAGHFGVVADPSTHPEQPDPKQLV
ncbi:MAG: glycosyltransferase family 4 protein, partial [Cyanobacteria bacterium J06641_5]